MRHLPHTLVMKTTYGRLLLGLCLALSLLMATTVPAMAAPKKIATAKPGDCKACHGSEKVLPADHKDVKAMAYTDCLGCHEKTGASTLRGKMPASHIHQFAGVNCAKCHGKTKKPEEVKMKQCVACHNTDKLAEKTAKVKPSNPHESPHYGRTLDCNLCHHQHGKSENFCSQCHKFDFVVP
jgi:hypothetical protein